MKTELKQQKVRMNIEVFEDVIHITIFCIFTAFITSLLFI